MIRRRVLTIRETIPARRHRTPGPSYHRLVPRRLLAVLVVATIALAACGTDDAETGTAAGDDPTPAPAAPSDDGDSPEISAPSPDPETDVAVPDFLDFTAEDVRGDDPVDASTYAGSDLVLWFWAPW